MGFLKLTPAGSISLGCSILLPWYSCHPGFRGQLLAPGDLSVSAARHYRGYLGVALVSGLLFLWHWYELPGFDLHSAWVDPGLPL